MRKGVRQTVAGFVIRPERPYSLVAAHISVKATRHGNFTTAGGGIREGETIEAAMKRELKEEYGIDADNILVLEHPPFICTDNGKQYHWCRVLCNGASELIPQESEVAQADWWSTCPVTLTTLINRMSPYKANMFAQVFLQVLDREPALFGCFPKELELAVSRFREQIAA